jgi:hypothetical protein
MSDDIKTRIIQLSKQGLTANLIFKELRHEFPSETYRTMTTAIDDLLGNSFNSADFPPLR